MIQRPYTGSMFSKKRIFPLFLIFLLAISTFFTYAKQKNAKESIVQEPETIRVLISTDNYGSYYHNELLIGCSDVFSAVESDGTKSDYQAGETVTYHTDSDCLQSGSVTLTSENGVFMLPGLLRNQESPQYEGSLTITKSDEGLILVNELPFETYLTYVVPSEMPSYYPEEALKAQAVCARTYALKKTLAGSFTELGADLDDSVTSQVYNNIGTTDETIQAVKDTAGVVLYQDGVPADAQYYSTTGFLQTNHQVAGEEQEKWYHWEMAFTTEELTELFQDTGIGSITNINVSRREDNGRCECLELTGEDGSYRLEGEYDIRKALYLSGKIVTLADGSETEEPGMLPSAFFQIEDTEDGVILTGGGFGHGNGMSQNGAKYMAESGSGWKEILKYYYGDGVKVVCSE